MAGIEAARGEDGGAAGSLTQGCGVRLRRLVGG